MLSRVRRTLSFVGDIDLDGIIFPADGAVLNRAIRWNLRHGRYEKPEANVLRALLTPGDRVLELGSGLGYISALCARAGKAAAIVTVEANPLLADYILQLHERNGVAELITRRHGVALPNPTSEQATFYRREDFWASSLSAAPWAYTDAISVPVLDLNALVAEHRPTLMIIDIEGGEASILDGADLSGVRKLMLELHQEVIGRAGMRRVFDELGRRGFAFDTALSSGPQAVFVLDERAS